METAFSVRLSFNQEPETLVVPFEAIIKLYDTSVAFGLMFDETDEMDEDELDVAAGNISDTFIGASDSEAKDASEDEKQAGEVISLDSFRDK